MGSAYTEDLADFGPRERLIASKLLALPLPGNFYYDGVKLAFNRYSGHVFLVNSDYQAAMINPKTDNLEIWHSTPYDGHEGFLSDLLEEYSPDDLHSDDVEYLKCAANAEGVALPGSWNDQPDLKGL